MSKKNKVTINGKTYYRITRTIGHKVNSKGEEVNVSKAFYGKTKKEAEDKYRNYIINLGIRKESRNQYFGITADYWIYNFFINNSKIKSSTKRLYINAWNKYLRTMDMYYLPIDKVTSSVIQSTYNKINCSLSAIKNIHKLMRHFYKYLEQEDIVKDITASLVIPDKDIKRRLPNNEIITWNNKEIERILNSFHLAQDNFRLRFFIVLAYFTGCRINEILALSYNDINHEEIIINKSISHMPVFAEGKPTKYHLGINTPKTANSIRKIPITEYILKELHIHKTWHNEEMKKNNYSTTYIFTTDSGNLYDDKNVRKSLNRYYTKIGVPAKSPHTYRHTFGTNLCRNGIPIQIAAQLMGHKDINVTAQYYVQTTYEDKLSAVKTLINNINPKVN